MNAFLERHQIDVGRTAAVLLFAAMVEEIYSSIFVLVGGPGIFLNLGIIILFYLGVGMWRHRNLARQWCLVLTYFAAALVVIMIVLAPFLRGVTLDLSGYTETDPPFWKILLVGASLAPLIAIILLALHSEKARKEFSTDPDDGSRGGKNPAAHRKEEELRQEAELRSRRDDAEQ